MNFSAPAGYRKVSSPYGFSMLGVEASAELERKSRAAQEIVRAHGYERIMPAMIDYPETFSENSHAEMFSVKDNSGERLAVRNDITAQVIKGYVRQLEQRKELALRKFYYAAPVYKDVRKNYPLPREIYQIGCEVIGENADRELVSLIAIARQILSEVFSLASATQVSSVELRNVFAEKLGSAYRDAESRRDAPGLAGLMQNAFSLTEADARKLAVSLFYPAKEAGMPAGLQFLPNEVRVAVEKAANETAAFVEKLRSSGIDAYWQPLSEPRSAYYTGIFFETYVPGFTEPMARGGVYNDLVRRYGQFDAGACGFALDMLKF